MDRKERVALLKQIGSKSFVVIGTCNQRRKCCRCKGMYFNRLRFIGDNRYERVTAEYTCHDCDEVYLDYGWATEFIIHNKYIKKRWK